MHLAHGNIETSVSCSPEATSSVCSSRLPSALQTNFPASSSFTSEISSVVSDLTFDLPATLKWPKAERACV